MTTPSPAGTSAGRGPVPQTVPPCVAARARELLDLAILEALALSLGANAILQAAALATALLAPPLLHYLPEVG